MGGILHVSANGASAHLKMHLGIAIYVMQRL
jgi:hypothetical protein